MFVPAGVRKRLTGIVFLLGFTALLSMTLLMPNQVNAQTSPNLGEATRFAVLAGSTVTNTGPSVVNGDLGVSPGSSVTGFPPGSVTPPGTTHAADAAAGQAQTDATAAYNTLASEPCTQNLSGQDLGGMTLTTGVYCFDTSAQLTGQLTLDAGGNAGAVFVFKMGSTLTTASGSSVLVTNGGSVCNVWWQVGSSATLGTTTSFAGNILALTSITLTTNANVSGRALAQTGAVTMDSNTVDASACIIRGLSLTKTTDVSSVLLSHDISYTFSYQNTGNVALDNVTLTDTLPADTSFSSGTSGWDCTVSVNLCTINLGTLAPGATGSAILTLTVNKPAGAVHPLSNSARIASGDTSAVSLTVTTPVTTLAPPASGATAVPVSGPVAVFTAVPPASAPPGAVSGLPNTGGGPPQPTYWLHGNG